MAGVAYDVTKNFKLDVGYRYRHIEGGDMFDSTRTTRLAPSARKARIDYQHEVSSACATSSGRAIVQIERTAGFGPPFSFRSTPLPSVPACDKDFPLDAAA